MKRAIPIFLILALVLSSFACAAGDTGFTDVSGDAWYAEAVAYSDPFGVIPRRLRRRFGPA